MSRTLAPWKGRLPWVVGDFEREMENLMERLFSDGNSGRSLEPFVPRTTVAETELAYEIDIDLPGVKPDDLKVEVRGQELWLCGERCREKEEKGKTYHRIEQEYGRFERVIPLAMPVDKDKVEAKYRDGILRITVPKNEEDRPKHIPVST